MPPPKHTHQPPPRDETQWLSTLPGNLCSKWKSGGDSHLLVHNQNSASCSSAWSPSTISPREKVIWWHRILTRCSGTHHQKLEITPTLNKKGSLVSTQKFSWISSTRASPRPRLSLGNVGEVVPLAVPPGTQAPHCPHQNRKLLRQSRDWVSWVQVLQTRLLPSAGEDLTATEDWKPERSSVRSTVPNTKWTEVKMAGNSEKARRQLPNTPSG